MKKIFLGLFLCMIFTSTLNVSAAKGITNTGHSDIVELDFIEQDKDYKLLNQLSDLEINSAYKKIKRRGFGWNVYEINSSIPIWYIKDVIFSKSNNTTQQFSFTYNTKKALSSELELSASGSIATKVSGKIKSLSASVGLDADGEISKSQKEYFEEKTNFKIELYPGKKISLLVKGDAYLYTGVGKYYIFGLPFYKGTWEYVDFVSEYYEFFEEEL